MSRKKRMSRPSNTEAVLISRPVPCSRCQGCGILPVFACRACLFTERISRRAGLPCAEAAWYFPESLGGDVFPCGHALAAWSVESGQAECPDCEEGAVLDWKTEQAWARLDRREARRRKLEASEAARALAENSAGWGYSRHIVRQMLRFLTPRCEAHCQQSGKPCRNRVVLGKLKCRLHGGLSTGARTAEGRARISESNRRRWSECKKHAE